MYLCLQILRACDMVANCSEIRWQNQESPVPLDTESSVPPIRPAGLKGR